MKNIAISACLLMIMLIGSACSNVEAPQQEAISTSINQAKQINTRTELLRVYTDLTEESNGWIVPENVNTMTIYAEAENTETVLFWIAPTGTETGTERKLIGYDTDGSDGWSYTWEFGSRTFHDHIQVQALGIDGSTQANMYINVHTP
jgi:hypothetical protein